MLFQNVILRITAKPILRMAALVVLLFCLPLPAVHAQELTEQQAQFQMGLDALISSDFADIEKGVVLLGQSGDERAKQILVMLLDGELYRHKKDKKLVIIQGKEGSKYKILALFSDQKEPEVVSKRKVKRVAINNQLRRQIKSEIALLNLSSSDAGVRAESISQMMGKVDAVLAKRLLIRQEIESDETVKNLIEAALAIYQLNSDDVSKAQKLDVLSVLGDSYQSEARNALTEFIAAETDPVLVKEANNAIGLIEQRITVAEFAETLFFGLSLGSVLVLSAIGLAITFGVMGVINMAHGELMMLGAYTTYVVQTLMPESIGTSIFISIPVAFMVAGLVGIIIERSVIRFLYGRPLETLLATFGISLILQQTVRSIFSPLNRSVATPDWMAGVIEINPLLSLTLNRLYIIGFCLAVFALLFFILRYTRLGIEVRAVSQNRNMARAMGVRSEWVDAMTFGLGSGIAGVAGVALSQLTNVGPNLGQAYIIDSFMVVVFGGVGNLWGTLVAGMSLGIANKIMEPWAGAVLAKILVLVFIILFIQKKPRGLFPQKGRSAEG
jgi:urea transport system permease protein